MSFESDFKTRKRDSRTVTYLLYDSDCGPCTSFKKIVKRLDLRGQIVPVSLQDPEAIELARPSMSKQRMAASFHLIELSNETRQVFSAGDGAIRLTKYFPLGFLIYPLVNQTKFLRQLVRRVYFQATRFRTSESCGLDTVRP
ncbi:MAG: DCC1-like thiol-disulfide oxidoreductase family protein [Thaumarchaeota archaeon]|nr:DCC1-like thiol-disulfide oxidoreductase family protein [Nitrososphaerota archaeon]